MKLIKMYELHKTTQCSISAYCRRFSIKPNSCEFVYGAIPTLEYHSLCEGVLHKPARSYAALKNWLKKHLSQVFN